jgi:kinesin family protein 2/24
VDADFDLLIDQRKKVFQGQEKEHVSSNSMGICIVIRKRPLFDKEYVSGEIDCITSVNPKIVVHECKLKVDGITKVVEDSAFNFDNTFSESETTEDLYIYTI